MTVYPTTWLAQQLVEKICDAMIVASIIGLVVELSSFNSVVARVSEAVARKMSAFHLPPALRDLIWNTINIKLIRYDYERRYRLLRISGGKLLIDSSIDFKVSNCGTAPAEYSPYLGEEEAYKPKFLHIEYGLPNGRTNAFDEESLRRFTHQRDTGAYAVQGLPKLTLRPLTQVPGEVCRVSMRFTTIMPEEYSDITAFGGPTIDPVIQLDEIPEDLEFMSPGDDVEHSDQGRRWKYCRPFLQGQHVRVWWRQRAKHE